MDNPYTYDAYIDSLGPRPEKPALADEIRALAEYAEHGVQCAADEPATVQAACTCGRDDTIAAAFRGADRVETLVTAVQRMQDGLSRVDEKTDPVNMALVMLEECARALDTAQGEPERNMRSLCSGCGTWRDGMGPCPCHTAQGE